MVVQHSGQQVIGRADGVEIAGKMEVDVLHGHHLRIAAAGCTALYAEHGAEGGLPQAEQGVLAQLCHSVGQTDTGGSLALTGGGGVDGGNKDQLALAGLGAQRGNVDLGLHLPVVFQQFFVNAGLFRNRADGQHFGALSDLNISHHNGIVPFSS